MAVTSLIPYGLSVQSFAGGLSIGKGIGDTWTIAITNPGSANDQLALNIISNGATTVLAAGDAIGTSPMACLTLANRVYNVNGTELSFSALGDPTQFEQQGTGAGFINMANQFAQAQPLQGLAPYQGLLAIFARRSAQIWAYNADPTQFTQQQVLPNTGTFAPQSTQALGDLDVLYLYDTGIRSLRLWVNSLSAIVVDIGTPVDSLVQADIQAATAAHQLYQVCATVEPTTGRYWLYINENLYVLSYYPSSKIVAWAVYKTTFQSGSDQLAFVPQKFEIYNGQAYATDGTAIYQYGGADNNTYDNCVATVQTPLYDLKSPGTLKKANSLDAAITGTWQLSFGCDSQNPTVVNAAYTGSDSTFQLGEIPVAGDGYHFQFKAQTTGSEYARVSELILHYREAGEK